MPAVTTCPSCSKQLRVPDELFGKGVKCPTCGATFTAHVNAATAAPPPPPPAPAVADSSAPPPIPTPMPSPPPLAPSIEPASVPMGGPPIDDYADQPAQRRRRPRPQYEPHRGALILVLGILSIVMLCFPLGIVAWVLGNGDLQRIRNGQMDPDGEGMTRAGWICGMLGVALSVLGGCFITLIVVVAVANQK